MAFCERERQNALLLSRIRASQAPEVKLLESSIRSSVAGSRGCSIPTGRRRRGGVASALFLAAAFAGSSLYAQAVTVGPITFEEPEFPAGSLINDLTVTTLDGVPIPSITFRSSIEIGVNTQLDEIFGETVTSALTDPTLAGGFLEPLRFEFGGDATALSFDFGMAAPTVNVEDVFAPSGIRVRLLAASGVEVGGGTAPMVFPGFPGNPGNVFGTHFAATSGQPFRTAVIEGTFTVPIQDAAIYLDNLAYTAVPDEPPPVELGPEERFSTTGEVPAIATDARGRRAIAWEESAGGSREVFAQLFDANGQPLGAEFRVNERSSSNDLSPSLAFDANGELVVAWLRGSIGAASVGGAGSILGRRFEPASGTPLSGESVLAQGAAAAPTVDSAAGGDAVVTWTAGANVLGRRMNRGGAPVGNAFEVSPATSSSASRVAVGASGDFMVVWTDPTGTAGSGGASVAAPSVVGRFFDPSGAPKGGVVQVSSAGGAAGAPAAAADAAGNVVVVWQQAGANGNDVLARKFTAGGAPRGAPFPVQQEANGEQTAPSVAVNAVGDFVVVWESAPLGSGGGASVAETSIVGRVFSGSSGAASEEVEIATVEGGTTPGAPQVTLDENDDATVVFQKKTSGGAEAGLFSKKLTTALPPAPCAVDDVTLCLAGNRFEVKVSWRDFDGNTGEGQAVSLTSDTGYFWFFDAANVEIVLKVLDARAINDFFWVFYGALSNVEYTITVHDTVTGLGKTYFNPANRFASAGDTSALPGSARVEADNLLTTALPGSAATALTEQAVEELLASDGVVGEPWHEESPASAGAACTAGANTLCLTQSRFAVTIAWKDFDGNTGQGNAQPLSSDTGYFWFFDPANVEVVVKVLDARSINGQFWVFYGALSNVEFTLTVTDTVTGTSKIYFNPLDTFASVGDTSALPGG